MTPTHFEAASLFDCPQRAFLMDFFTLSPVEMRLLHHVGLAAQKLRRDAEIVLDRTTINLLQNQLFIDGSQVTRSILETANNLTAQRFYRLVKANNGTGSVSVYPWLAGFGWDSRKRRLEVALDAQTRKLLAHWSSWVEHNLGDEEPWGAFALIPVPPDLTGFYLCAASANHQAGLGEARFTLLPEEWESVFGLDDGLYRTFTAIDSRIIAPATEFLTRRCAHAGLIRLQLSHRAVFKPGRELPDVEFFVRGNNAIVNRPAFWSPTLCGSHSGGTGG